ncbi:UPF0158 family protein [Syntrophomonas wolfei]|uniref:UPF0158 family protein n=1 Tax=Syntrophomonas wolfei TaxID=863 RepID=UPI0007733FEE|nr:UPF0158 family protein [Syntrophomonas wolfei]
MPVKISELIDEMDMQMDEYHTYLNKETNIIVTVSNEGLSIAEESDEGDDFSQYPDWQKQNIMEALDIIVNWDKYVELPDKYDINEYNIMENFCFSLDNEKIMNELLYAIRGRGAFRRFKDKVQRLGIQQQWDKFREETFKEIAIEWCEYNNIPYI